MVKRQSKDIIASGGSCRSDRAIYITNERAAEYYFREIKRVCNAGVSSMCKVVKYKKYLCRASTVRECLCWTHIARNISHRAAGRARFAHACSRDVCIRNSDFHKENQ